MQKIRSYLLLKRLRPTMAGQGRRAVTGALLGDIMQWTAGTTYLLEMYRGRSPFVYMHEMRLARQGGGSCSYGEGEGGV